MIRPAAASLLLLTTGCEALSEFVPTAEFESIEVEDITWNDIDSRFNFRVNNPNPIEIKLDRFDYTLSFGGVEWLAGENPDGLALAESGSTIWVLPVQVDFPGLFDVVDVFRGEDVVDFGLAGSFGFDTERAGPIDLPFDAAGDFPALRAPRFDIGRLRAEPIDWSSLSVDLVLELDVDNELGSTLGFFNVDYGVSMAGVEVTSGFLSELGQIDGAEAATVELPFRVDLLSVGLAAYDMIVNRTAAEITLDSVLEVDTPFGVVPLELALSRDDLSIE